MNKKYLCLYGNLRCLIPDFGILAQFERLVRSLGEKSLMNCATSDAVVPKMEPKMVGTC